MNSWRQGVKMSKRKGHILSLGQEPNQDVFGLTYVLWLRGFRWLGSLQGMGWHSKLCLTSSHEESGGRKANEASNLQSLLPSLPWKLFRSGHLSSYWYKRDLRVHPSHSSHRCSISGHLPEAKAAIYLFHTHLWWGNCEGPFSIWPALPTAARQRLLLQIWWWALG